MARAQYSGRDWIAADTFIRGGRNPESHRRFGKTRELHRLPNGDIALRLHQTDIVTYHKDGGFVTIFMNGWNTYTTKQDIRAYSPARIGRPDRALRRILDGAELCVFGPDDPVSEPRVQKCRKCHGEGVVHLSCNPAAIWHGKWWMREWRDAAWAALPGITYTRRREAYEWESDRADADGMMTLTEVRCRSDHDYETCSHGFLEPHFWDEECYRCSGTGRVDYGSKPVPYPFDPYDRVTVDAEGRVLLPEAIERDLRIGLVQMRRRMRQGAA